ncbi:MAG: citramalate synthase [Elusimicrobiota bacterium]|jgi:2-isopropylmalate synthase|nr:citramalate synthase [Elusimicrobiota bacterium]
MKLFIYDTTLRDGAQTEGISFSLDDKLKIVRKLDEFGVNYIECGWPGSNPKDMEFFIEVKKLKLKHAKIVAFGSTRYKNIKIEHDKNLKSMIEAKPDAITIFGKSWDLHVKDALETTLEENLSMIFDSIKFLKENNFEVIYDAEHFFDGYKNNIEYALKTIEIAEKAGANIITLCDTNGNTLPMELTSILRKVKDTIKIPFGIHFHNDSGVADANSIIAINEGAKLVQGTINGYGERCGNADIITIIANAILKIGCETTIKIEKLREISYFVSEIVNKVPQDNHPYTGISAFAHKAGVHVSAIVKNPKTYEHVNPVLVGNERRIIVSELSGKSNIFAKIKELNLDINLIDSEKLQKIVDIIKSKENSGYHFEGADASFELILRKEFMNYKPFFELEGFKIIIDKDEKGFTKSEATVRINVKGNQEKAIAIGDGPVNALDKAIRKASEKFYSVLKNVSLVDFKVRVIDSGGGTDSKVRVLIESRDEKNEWTTIGVSENILEASWQALLDSIEYKLIKSEIINN